MNSVVPEPSIAQDPEGGHRLTIWFSQTAECESTAPMRALLEKLETLSNAPVAVSLPPVVDHEDFVSGTLTWRGQSLPVYFEHSLGYMDIGATNRELLEEVLKNVLSMSHDA